VKPTDDPRDGPPDHGRPLLDRLRGSGVGTEDPNIVGDAGPTDVAPGGDPVLQPLTAPLPPEEETPSERLLPSEEEFPRDVEVVEVIDIVVLPAGDEQ
jgi:hypothetical protein